MDSLYEIKYIDNESHLPTTNLTFLNPYHNYLKSFTFLRRTLNTIIHPSTIKIKEYVQSTSFSSYQLPATIAEQYITLEYPSQFTQEWISKDILTFTLEPFDLLLLSYHFTYHPFGYQIPNFEHANLETV